MGGGDGPESPHNSPETEIIWHHKNNKTAAAIGWLVL